MACCTVVPFPTLDFSPISGLFKPCCVGCDQVFFRKLRPLRGCTCIRYCIAVMSLESGFQKNIVPMLFLNFFFFYCLKRENIMSLRNTSAYTFWSFLVHLNIKYSYHCIYGWEIKKNSGVRKIMAFEPFLSNTRGSQ